MKKIFSFIIPVVFLLGIAFLSCVKAKEDIKQTQTHYFQAEAVNIDGTSQFSNIVTIQLK